MIELTGHDLSLETIEAAAVHLVVPRVGAVGASGDLAPLSHIALARTGEGKVEFQGVIRDTRDVFTELGVEAVELREKEIEF